MWAQITSFTPDSDQPRLDGDVYTFVMIDQDMVMFQSAISDATANFLVDYEQMGDNKGSVFRQMISAIVGVGDGRQLVGRQFSDEMGVGDVFPKMPPLNTKLYPAANGMNDWTKKVFANMQDVIIQAGRYLHEQPVPMAFEFEGGAVWLEIDEQNGCAVPVVGWKHPDFVSKDDANGLGGLHAADMEGVGAREFNHIGTVLSAALEYPQRHMTYISSKIPKYTGDAK